MLSEEAPHFFIFRNEVVEGPFALADLETMMQAGAVDASTPCAPADSQEWSVLGAIFQSRDKDGSSRPSHHDVFVSHSSKDKAVADAVCACLEGRGIRCWVAPRDIPPGAVWGEAIIDGLNASRAMVLILSSNANASQQVMREVERAVDKGLSILPLRIEDTPLSKSMEYFLSSAHWLDACTPPMQRHLDSLGDRVAALISGNAGTQANAGRDFPAKPSRSRAARIIVPVAVGAALLLGGFSLWVWQARKTGGAVEAAPVPATQSAKAAAPAENKSWIGFILEAMPEVNAGWLGAAAGGLVIAYIYPDSPAAAAGLAAGDVVLKIGDTPVPNLAAFQTVNISSLPAGSNLDVIVLRAGRQQTVDVVLGRRPDNEKSDDFNDESYPRWTQVKQFILPGQLTTLRVSDSFIGCAAYEGPVTFWDPSHPSDSPPVAEVKVATSSMGSPFVDLSEDGRTAVVAGSYGDAAIYNVAAGRKKFSLCDAGDKEIVGCRIDRAGKQAIALDAKSNFRVWDAETGKEIYTENFGDALAKIQGTGVVFRSPDKLGPFSPSGRFVMFSSFSGLFVWNVAQKRIDWSWKTDEEICAFAPSHDWSMCAVSFRNGAIKLLSMQTSQIVATLRGHQRAVGSLAWHGNSYLASASMTDLWVGIWDIKSSRLIWQLPSLEPGLINLGAYVAEFDPHKPRIWSFRHTLREFDIPPLADVDWSIVRAKEDAVDFSLSLRDSNLSVASSVTSDIGGAQKTFRYTFSDGSYVSGATDPSGEPVDYVFFGAAGVPLDGQLGVVLAPDGVITEVAPGGAAAAAGLRPRQKLLGTAEQEAGPFYRLPPSGDAQAAFVRLRACRGPVGSSVWLRIQDESGKVATVKCEIRKMP